MQFAEENYFVQVATNSHGNIFILTYSDIFKSVDNGNTWTDIYNFYNSICYDLIIDNNDNIFVGAGHYTGGGSRYAAIYESKDNGDSWININNDFSVRGSDVLNLSLSKNGNLTAGTAIGLYVYDKESWSEITNGLNLNSAISTPLTTCSDSLNHIFVGINDSLFKFIDNGNHWEKIFSGAKISFLFTNSADSLFILTDKGIYISADKGNNWININKEFIDIRSYALDSNDDIFIGTLNGVYHSTDNGHTWLSFKS